MDGARIWWVAQSYPGLKASHVWEDLKRSLRHCWVSKHETTREIVLPNGGEISVRSADNPDSLRGAGLDGLIVDEAAFIAEDAWKESLRATVADKDGWVIMQTTPNGRNWVYREFQKAAERERWERWQSPSWVNPLMRPSVLAEIEEEIGPRSYAQEYGAQFMEVEGALWPGVYFEEDRIYTERWPDAFDVSAIACDPSMGATETSDYCAIVFVGLSGGKLWVDADIKRRPPGETVEAYVRMWDHYHPDGAGFEFEAMQGLFGELIDAYCRQHGRPPIPIWTIRSERKSKVQRIQRLDPHLAKSRFRFRRRPGTAILLEQLMMFPVRGFHDDGPDALEMSVRLMNRLISNVPPPEERVRA